MKRFIQQGIYIFYIKWMKLYNTLVYRNAYKKTSKRGNSDICKTDKIILYSQLEKYYKSRPLGPTASVCSAPSKSVYFGFGGKVVPCCFNRDYIIGLYPENSIAEILNGEKKRKLQQLLDDNDFSNGCQHCRSQIFAGNFQGVEARLYDKLKKSAGFPLEMIFELDNICNLECSMCNGEFSSSILKNRDHLQIATSPYGSDFFEQIKPYLKHLSVAKFLGGEPFLIKGYYEIWEELIKHNPKCFINLQTNGTIYNSRIEDLLKRGRFQIGVSIDSLNPELFEKIRKNSSLSEVLKNLDKFINLTKKSGSFVNVSVCPMQENWMEVPQIVNFCNRKNVFIYFNTVYSKGFNLQEFDAARLKAIIDLYKQSQISARTYINRRNKKFFLDLINQVELWYKNKYELEQTYLPRWEYTHENLIAAFKNKLSDDYLHFEFVILAGIDCLPERMLLNDFQKRMLEEINKEDLILSLVNETHGQIKQRLINFIEKSTFNIEI